MNGSPFGQQTSFTHFLTLFVSTFLTCPCTMDTKLTELALLFLLLFALFTIASRDPEHSHGLTGQLTALMGYLHSEKMVQQG